MMKGERNAYATVEEGRERRERGPNVCITLAAFGHRSALLCGWVWVDDVFDLVTVVASCWKGWWLQVRASGWFVREVNGSALGLMEKKDW